MTIRLIAQPDISKSLETMMTQMLSVGQTAAMVTQTTAKDGMATVPTVQMLKKMLAKADPKSVLTKRGRTRTINVVGGVQFDHRDIDQAKKFAEERAGASLLGYLYRIDWCRSSGSMRLIAYKIVKKTPRGWRIYLGPYSGTRQICETSHRKFASASVDVALESYRARKARYCAILEHQLSDAREMLAAANKPEAFHQSSPKEKLRFLIGEEEFTA